MLYCDAGIKNNLFYGGICMKKDGWGEGIKGPLFAAANSGSGFVSFYGEIFGNREIKRKYIIKGGPGTGKSGFMKRTASFVKEKGFAVEYYRCSSDPDSLDGIIINGKIAIIDGTAPHSADTELPGVRDEILNLGQFWDSEKLAARVKEVEELNTQKGGSYKRAYRYLSACLDMEEINLSLLMPCVLEEKMKKAAGRIVDKIPEGKGASVKTGVEGSVGMKGMVRFNSYARQARTVYLIDDFYGSAHLFLSEIVQRGLENNNSLRISYDPVSAKRPDSVYFAEEGICFAISDNLTADGINTAGRINMRRFVDQSMLSERKGEMRSNFRIANSLLSEAADAMREAGEKHFLLEKIYISCMDFSALDTYLKDFCERIEKML